LRSADVLRGRARAPSGGDARRGRAEARKSAIEHTSEVERRVGAEAQLMRWERRAQLHPRRAAFRRAREQVEALLACAVTRCVSGATNGVV
jgi:hypothetical protein